MTLNLYSVKESSECIVIVFLVVVYLFLTSRSNLSVVPFHST